MTGAYGRRLDAVRAHPQREKRYESQDHFEEAARNIHGAILRHRRKDRAETHTIPFDHDGRETLAIMTTSGVNHAS